MPIVAFYQSERDHLPKVVETTWDELAEALGPDGAWQGPCTINDCRGHDCPHKMRSPREIAAWSPVRLVAGGTRANRNVVALTALVLDLDGSGKVQITPDVLAEVARRLDGWRYVAHSSHADKTTSGGLTSMRIVVALEEDIPAAEWRAYRPAAIRALGLDDPRFGIDPSCKDESRIYFLPSSPLGYVPIYESGEGRCLPRVLPGVPVSGTWSSYQGLHGSSTPLPAPQPIILPPQPPAEIDLTVLRQVLSEHRRSLAHMKDDESKVRADLLRRALEGKALAEPGARGGTINQLAAICAFALPPGTPVDAFMEIIRVAMMNTSTAPTPGSESQAPVDHWKHAMDAYCRAQHRRAIVEAQQKAENMQFMERLAAARKTQLPQAAGGQQTVPDGCPSVETEDAFKPLVNKDGSIKNCGDNIRRLLETIVPGVFRWNEYAKQLEIVTHDGLKPESVLDVNRWKEGDVEDLGTHVTDDLMKWTDGINWRYQDVERHLMSLARKHKYNPLCDYLNSLVWDGTERIYKLFITYFGAEDTPHMRRFSRRWMLGAVERAMVPGCKFDTLLTLEGSQGAKKTSSLEALAGPFFCSTQIDFKNKDSMILAGSNFIICLDELAGKASSQDTREFKEFVSRRKDDFRPPYGRVNKKIPRSCVLVATTDQKGWITDLDGNRRYWCVKCGFIDVAAIIRDRDQLWAEAMHIRRQSLTCQKCLESPVVMHEQRPCCEDHQWWLNKEEEIEAALDVETRAEEEPWQDRILDWWLSKALGKRQEFLTTSDIATGAITGMTIDRVDKRVSTRIGSAMKKLGFKKCQRRVNKVLTWVYESTEELRTREKEKGPLSLVPPALEPADVVPLVILPPPGMFNDQSRLV